MARRGEVLREHILDTAKEAFLEAGFERTSMDALAARAQTSKRSLYAHFPTKEVLFLAVVDRVDELFQGRMQTPEHYADDPVEAVTLYCARFVQMLGWQSIVQTCRLAITTATQFPEAAARLHAVFFGTTTTRLATYLARTRTIDEAHAIALADDLIGSTVYPHLPQLLFGVHSPHADLPELERLADDVDLRAVRRAVSSCLAGS